jgi:hypothetical protein
MGKHCSEHDACEEHDTAYYIQEARQQREASSFLARMRAHGRVALHQPVLVAECRYVNMFQQQGCATEGADLFQNGQRGEAAVVRCVTPESYTCLVCADVPGPDSLVCSKRHPVLCPLPCCLWQLLVQCAGFAAQGGSLWHHLGFLQASTLR